MTAYQAYLILDGLSEQELMDMNRKIYAASKKIRHRTTNVGHPYGEPKRLWRHRSGCSVCGEKHEGVRCPIRPL